MMNISKILLTATLSLGLLGLCPMQFETGSMDSMDMGGMEHAECDDCMMMIDQFSLQDLGTVSVTNAPVIPIGLPEAVILTSQKVRIEPVYLARAGPIPVPDIVESIVLRT